MEKMYAFLILMANLQSRQRAVTGFLLTEVCAKAAHSFFGIFGINERKHYIYTFLIKLALISTQNFL